MIKSQTLKLENKNGLSGNQLKIIAIIAMTVDHLTMRFMPTNTVWQIVLYQILRAFGRLTIIIMCYLAADGYHYTKNLKKYMIRLFIFAIISHFAYSFIYSGNLLFIDVSETSNTFQTSVIWSILIGVMLLYVYKNENFNNFLKIFLVLLLLSFAILSDWNIIAVLYIFVAEIFRKDKTKKITFYILISIMASTPALFNIISQSSLWYQNLFMLGVIPACLILKLYNGTRGNINKFSKWSFYIYYPLHLFIIGLVYMFLIGF